MTLNLMLTSKEAVYLSADFRLTSIKEGTPLPDSYDTQKLIPVIRRDWSALIAYIGVASAPPVIDDVGEWIGEQMDSIPRNGVFAELSTRLLRFNHWLKRIRGHRCIAFSAVGFSDQRPFMMLISNFLDSRGHLVDARPQLNATLRRSDQPEVRAVGTARPDVFERVRLERLLQARSPRRSVPELIRDAIADINAQVSRRSRGSISEQCVSGYLLRSGAAAIGAHRIPAEAACLPHWVQRDLEKGGVVGFESAAHEEGRLLPIQWKGMVAKTIKGTTIRIHEIANAGEPILDASRDTTSQLPEDILSQMLRQLAAKRTRSRLVVMNGAADDAICVLRCNP